MDPDRRLPRGGAVVASMVALNTALADNAVATSATHTRLNWMLGADCIRCRIISPTS
jgi:hypothetical protein